MLTSALLLQDEAGHMHAARQSQSGASAPSVLHVPIVSLSRDGSLLIVSCEGWQAALTSRQR